MKKSKNFNRLLLAIGILIMVPIILLFSKSLNTKGVVTRSYDYESDKVERFTDFKSDEGTSFSKVKSSVAYKIKPITLSFTPNDLSASIQKQPENYPFEIKSLTHKNNGLFLCIEFKDSGFIKDFQLTIKVNEITKTIKQPLIDCSNKIKLYVPLSISKEVTKADIDVTISNIYWRRANVTNLATINYEKDLATTNNSKVVVKKSENKNNAFTLKYNNSLDLTLEKTSYNSLHLMSGNHLNDLAKSLNDLILSRVSTKYYIVFVSSHNQTNSNKFYLHQKENTILKSDDKIEQIKICIEKE